MSSEVQPLVAGNWKMNGLRADLATVAAIRDAVEAGAAGCAEVLVCPPFTLVAAAADLVAGSGLKIGAQACRAQPCGAFTGDVSAAMLKDAGAAYVILGHSERRAGHGESDAGVRAAALAALAAGLSVIVCVGETKAERDAGQAEAVVRRQILGSIPDHPDPARVVVAYEPVWAIGTGLTPSVADVAAMHEAIRREVERLDPRTGARVRLLYGGSVRPGNAAELMAVANVNGGLIGGASLDADDFLGIAGVYREAPRRAVSA